jgi:hypothetical protein
LRIIHVPQNLVQGELVNGSLGKIIEFKAIEPSDNPLQRVAHVQSRPNDLWPVVKFTNGKVMTIVAQEFTINNASGEFEAMRSQVSPLSTLEFIVLIEKGATHSSLRSERTQIPGANARKSQN